MSDGVPPAAAAVNATRETLTSRGLMAGQVACGSAGGCCVSPHAGRLALAPIDLETPEQEYELSC